MIENEKIFSFYKAPVINKNPFENINLTQSYELIKSKKYEEITKKLREKEKEKQSEIKKTKLDYITFGGTFKKRHGSELKKQSGYVAIDIDHINKDIEELKQELKKDEYVKLLFISPSGEGLKIIIEIPLGISEFKQRATSFYYYLSKKYNIPRKELDTKTTDISRACFLCYDPDAYLNLGAELYKEKTDITIIKQKMPSTTFNKNKILKEGVIEGNRNNDFFELAKERAKAGISPEITLSELLSIRDRTPNGKTPILDEEIKKIVESVYNYEENKHNNFDNFILDTEKLPQQIDHALGIIKVNNKKLRYYGSFVNQKIKEDTKGGMIEKKKLVPALILENKKILSEYNKHLFNDIEFSFKTKMSLINNRWSLEGISDFLKTEKYDEVSYKEVFEEFKQIFKESMVFEKQEWYDVQALWCMTTYFQDFQDKSLIIKLEGASGSAKSKTGKIMANLSFNGKKFLCPTFAAFVRYRNNNKASLFIEEAEKLDEELVEALNGSYERGNVVPRQNKDNYDLTDEFDPYGWTMIGAINKLEGALKKRSITQYQIKAKKNDKRAEIEIASDQDPLFVNARKKMYILGLLNYNVYLDKYSLLNKPDDLHNREWVISKPLLTMASCISEDLFKSTSDFLVQRFYVRDDEDIQEDSWDFILFNVLLDLTKTTKEEKFISNQDLKNSFTSILGETYNKISSHAITKIMTKIGFGDFKKRNFERTQRGYFLHFLKVCEIGIRTEIININFLEKKLSEVSFLSNNIFNREEIKKWYSDTFSDKDTFLEMLPDTSDKKDRTDTFSEGVYKKNSEVEEVDID